MSTTTQLPPSQPLAPTPVQSRPTFRIVRPDCYWGKSRTGKTINVGLMAEYIREKYNLSTRLVCADGEGCENIQALIDDGTIVLFRVKRGAGASGQKRFTNEDFTRLSMGWWPEAPDNPDAKLVPPSKQDWSKVGAYAFESMSSIAAQVMLYQTTDVSLEISKNIDAAKAAKMLATGEAIYVTDGEMKWRFSGLGDYGFGQRRLEEWIKNSAHLPVKKTVWSGLESRGETSEKRPVYGPLIIGQAATGDCPAWFGNMLHFTFISAVKEVPDPTEPNAKLKVEVARRMMFLAPHIEPNDPYKIECLAGLRLPAYATGQVPDVMEPNVKKLYELLDKLEVEEKAKRAAAVKAVQSKS